MKRILLALLCVACTGTAWAQTQTSPPPPAQPSVTVFSVKPGAVPAQGPTNQQVSGGHCCDGPACDSHGRGHGIFARSAPAGTLVPLAPPPTKYAYSSMFEQIVFRAGCSESGSCGSCDTGCGPRTEGCSYTRGYLIKKIDTSETGPCGSGRCGGILQRHHRQDAPCCVVEPIAIPPAKR